MSSHIEYQRFHRGESCAEEGCRARKFYVEDGKKFCQRGHEQAGFTQTQQDEDDWNAQGKKSRKRKEEKERVETILGGGGAKELYLQCYQLILWKQCHWLITILGLPNELRVVVRDLWELRLRVLHFSRDDRSTHGSGTGTMIFSSASEGDNTDTDGTTHRSVASRRSRKSIMKEEKLPRLIETLALCYLGTLLLKVPVSVGDFYRWAVQDRIMYNRAIKEIPKEMRSKIPAHFHAALEIKAPLDGAKLHMSVASLAEFYNLEFDMEFPRPNVPLLTFRFMTDLCLPVDLYPAIRRLETLLELDLSYHALGKRTYDTTSHPEIQLMSLVVIATKLAYPFDDIDRIPGSFSDPSAVKVNWSQWIKSTSREPPKGLARGEAIEVTDADVWDMNAKKLDDYLDWYQNTWIDDRDPKSRSANSLLLLLLLLLILLLLLTHADRSFSIGTNLADFPLERPASPAGRSRLA
ncbi:RNA polymerase I-specific transcription initiation factor-like protein rrn7 [Rhexocercosporidium sp. MPI-PUGE-AT-0058]|nr:RNA polymerase I-specific transcription initiation factor-like protein rrn7 [Rhexocercosporidium sp. MPI-PUGE-AT-0058]